MMSSTTGRRIGLAAHIAQSVKNILFTRIGTRVQREEYGSLLPELLDMPLTPPVLMMCHAAAVSALARWEPRITVQAVAFDASGAAAGGLQISITAVIKGSGAVEKFLIEAV